MSGPRPYGKTTLGRLLLAIRATGAYHNGDDIEFRRLWAKQPRASIPASTGGCPLAVFDEIHKAKAWKRALKGIYDTRETPADILVTGSARLNVHRRGSDSLVGRCFPFRLHPFSLREMETAEPVPPADRDREPGVPPAGDCWPVAPGRSWSPTATVSLGCRGAIRRLACTRIGPRRWRRGDER